MNTECPLTQEAHAFLSGELTPVERAEFEQHLSGCVACGLEVETTRQLVTRLRAIPETDCRSDLAARVLTAAREPQSIPRQTMSWPRLAAIAATGMLLVGGTVFHFMSRTSPPLASASVASAVEDHRLHASQALDWFMRNQEADGSWDAEKWGGQRNYAPALTALPLLALASADQSNVGATQAADLAAHYLIALQNEDGSFGKTFQGSPYNTSIVTLALLHEWKRRPSAVPKANLDKAVAALAAQQKPEGGWGYRYSPMADRSITQWHIQALELAATLGWTETRPAVERGLAWLETHTTAADDAAEPVDSTSALLARATERPQKANDAVDFYQAYFVAEALRHESAVSAQQRLASLRQELVRHQTTEGSESGSWSPDDQWGRAGGRIYSTALASLALGNW